MQYANSPFSSARRHGRCSGQQATCAASPRAGGGTVVARFSVVRHVISRKRVLYFCNADRMTPVFAAVHLVV